MSIISNQELLGPAVRGIGPYVTGGIIVYADPKESTTI